MAEFIFDTLSDLFGSTLIEDCAEWMSKIIEGLVTVFNGDVMNTAYAVFVGIAGALMTIYLFMDILSNVSKDMITLERLILIFIKYFLAMMILIYLKDIIQTLFNLGAGIYALAADTFDPSQNTNITYFGSPTWPDWATVQNGFEDEFGTGVTAVVRNLGNLFKLLIPFIAIMLAKLAAYFITASNAVMLVARAIFAPFGVVQCFDEGQRSAGIRYLKKFAAEAITFAVILGILYACGLMTSSLLQNVYSAPPFNGAITYDNVQEVITVANLVPVVVLQMAAVGGVFTASRIANDILGVN